MKFENEKWVGIVSLPLGEHVYCYNRYDTQIPIIINKYLYVVVICAVDTITYLPPVTQL